MALVIGIGNPLRSDDGAGCAAARLLGERRPGLEVREVHQLTPELAEDLSGQDAVLFLDASVRIRGLALTEVLPDYAAVPQSHGETPAALLALTLALYGRRPRRCALLEIPARHLQLGGPLTPEVAALLPEAATLALAWLDQELTSIVSPKSLHKQRITGG